MFDILRKSLATGIVTEVSSPGSVGAAHCAGRGRPEIDFAHWKDARSAIAACPTGALAGVDHRGVRTVRLDIGKCTYCGLCAEANDPYL